MRRNIKLLTYITLISIVIGIFISDYTESALQSPALRLMTFAKHGSFTPHHLDEQNIPRLLYTQLESKEYYYNPVYIGIYALHYYDRWLESGENDYFMDYYDIFPNDDDPFQSFINSADWYCKNIVISEADSIRFGSYPYNFDWPDYSLKKGWVSGMAQGLAVQVLLRAYKVTKDTKYLNTAQLATNAFYVDIKSGGVTVKIDDDEWWFEEYASPNSKRSFVLNGMCHSLIAIREFFPYDPRSQIAFDKGIVSLNKHVAEYYNGWWTQYDRIGTTAKHKYHYININLLRYLFSQTGESKLQIYREWEKSKPHFLFREFIYQPPNYLDVVILFLNIFLTMSTCVIVVVLIKLYLK